MKLNLAQFHGVFFEESFEALDSMEAALLALKPGAADLEAINTLFRVAHSMKGGSATFGFAEIASFTHSLETLLDELRGNRLQVTQGISDLLLKSVDLLREMLRALQGERPIDAQRVADVQFDIEMWIAHKGAAPDMSRTAIAVAATAPHGDAAAVWEIAFRPKRELWARGNDPLRLLEELAQLGELDTRVDLSQLPSFDELDPQSCHLAWTLQLKTAANEAQIREVFEWAEGDCELEVRCTSLPEGARSQADAAQTDTQHVSGIGEAGSIRVAVEKIDELMNSVGALVITQSMLSEMGRELEGMGMEKFRLGLEQLERNIRELQDSVTRVRMLPISSVFSRFPRMVRDLAQKLGKEVNLIMSGGDTELDKTVLEKIGDPLVHLIRNSIDHGLEKPEARRAAGKNPAGTLRLHAWHRGGNIAVEVADDGAGLDTRRILERARERGWVAAQQELSAEQIHELIFAPGFSTAEQATDVSGRGVGLDVVRRNVKELGGAIELSSEPGRGARFVITLPLTLAIVDGQSVSVGRENYIVPLVSIVESLQLTPQNLNCVAGRGEVFAFRGDYVPVIRLHHLFGVTPRLASQDEGLIVVVEGDGHRAGLIVDELLGQQQVVIKSLDANLGRVDGISGATILGDGSVALILDIPGIIRRTHSRAHA